MGRTQAVTAMRLLVHADLRWPRKTGIGVAQAAWLSRAPPTIEIVDLEISSRIGSPASPLSIAQALARGAGEGVFWSPGFIPPLRSALPAIVTVHDLTHLHYYTKLHAAYYSLVLKPLYRRCRAVICVSEYTRQEFLEWSGMSPSRVFTVHNGVAHERFAGSASLGLGFPYILYPGNRRRHKNLPNLLKAYGRSALPRAGINLVLTGDPDERLRELASRLRVAERVYFAGQVTDDDLARLYRGATLTAFVSLYEGFGLPVLESMASGVPVLVSNLSALPEVAGNAALLIDPTSIEAITSGLERLSFDQPLREQLIQAGQAQAARFDWDVSAAKIWEIVAAAAP